MAPGEFRLRFRYGKTGRLRHLSHLEVIHAIERGARRADLPYAVTRGFNPHMKLAFGPALPVATAGLSEYFDIWLTRYLPAEETMKRLAGAMPPDLAPVASAYVGDDLPSLSAACTIALYEIRFEREDLDSDTFGKALDAVVRSGELSVRRKGKDKVFDLARSLPKEPSVRVDETGTVIELAVRMGQEGSLRPEALVGAALSRMDAEGAAIAVTRVDTLIEHKTGDVRPL